MYSLRAKRHSLHFTLLVFALLCFARPYLHNDKPLDDADYTPRKLRVCTVSDHITSSSLSHITSSSLSHITSLAHLPLMDVGDTQIHTLPRTLAHGRGGTHHLWRCDEVRAPSSATTPLFVVAQDVYMPGRMFIITCIVVGHHSSGGESAGRFYFNGMMVVWFVVCGCGDSLLPPSVLSHHSLHN